MSEDEENEKTTRIKKKIPIGHKDLTVDVELENEFVEDAKAFRDIAQKLSKRLQEKGVNIDSSEINRSNYLEHVKELNQLEAKEAKELLELEDDNNDYYEPVGRGQAGNLRLTPEQYGRSSKQEFDSVEEMIDSLRIQAKSGTKTERDDAELILDEMFKKTFSGRRKQPEFLDIEFEGEIDKRTGKESLIEKILKPYREKKRREIEARKRSEK